MYPLISNFAVVFKKKGFSGMLKYIKNIFLTDKKTPVVIFGAGYNWDDCLDDLQKAGIFPIYRISNDFQWLNKSLRSDTQSMVKVWDILKNDQEFNKFFKENNLNFLPILESRILFLIEKITLTCIFAYDDFFRLIIDKEIKAVISSTFSNPEGHIIAHAAHNAEIPVVTWQHGGYGEMDHPLLAYTELMSSDVHFIFGDGVLKYLEKPARLFRTRLVSVGSSSLEKLKYNQIGNKHSPKKVILYITTSTFQSNSTISTFPPLEDNLFWETEKAIVNILGKHRHFDVIVKLHPSNFSRETPLRSYIDDNGYDNFRFIKKERSVIELLSIADVIVFDLPFTTLLQALTTVKPLFAYLGHVHYDEDACFLLGKRAIYDQDLNCFKDKLEQYLSNAIYEADINNKEFLIKYGIASVEGFAGLRAAEALKQIINKSENSNCINLTKNQKV